MAKPEVFCIWAYIAAIQISFAVCSTLRPTARTEDGPPNRPSPKILGGTEAPAGHIPWQVSLQKGSGRHFCGGSIIDETHVITAAHCIAGKDPNSLVVVAGAFNMKNTSEVTQQRNWPWKLTRHPKYIELFGMNWDSAIIHLQYPFVFNNYVKPIRLAPKNHYPSPLARCITSGWGNDNRLGVLPVLQTTPNGLQVVNTTIVPRAVCNIPYLIGSRSLITRNMICSTNGLIQGTCNGDSGGPLVCYDLRNDKEPYLAGLTSFGVPPCGHPLFPSVFSNIGSQREFIDKEVGIQENRNTTENILQVLQGAIHEVENIGAGLLEILPIG